MNAERIERVLLVLTSLFVLAIECYMFFVRSLTLQEGWFALLLILLSFGSIVLRPRRDAVNVLSLLLASMSVLVSGISHEELGIFESWLGYIARVIWAGLFWLFPFAFLHFSLTFPVRSRWIEEGGSRLLYVYLPFLITLIWSLVNPIDPMSGEILFPLIIPVAFLLGLSTFALQYRYSLTDAEKNRLRIVIAGCIAGALPRFLTVLGGEAMPSIAQDLAILLMPIFPLSLSFAVLREDLSGLGRTSRLLLVSFFVAAGVLCGFFLLGLILGLAVEPGLTGEVVLASLLAAAILTIPLSKWASGYVATRFFFSQTSGLRKEDIPTSFMPIRPNPYIVGNPVRNPRMFFGRQEERRFIAGKLLGREEGSVIVLTGERRTGKTSILYQILEGSLGEEFFPVFLDMQSLLVESDMEFLSAILDRIQETLSCNNLPSEEILNQDTPFISFTGILGQLFETIPSKKIVFLIDEYELIESRIKEGKLSSDLPAYLSSLLEANPRLSLILTGSQKLSANPLWSPLLAKSYYREISFLKRPDAEELILAPLRGYVVFEGSTIEGVLRLTSGHPFYTQLVLQTLVDVINENQAIRIDRTLLEETKQRIADHPPPQLLYAWEGFSQEEKLVLTGLSTLLKTERSYAQSERIHRVLSSIPDRYRGEQDEVETRIILESLRQRGVLDRDQTRYRFKMDLLRVWVRQEFSVWSLLKLGVEETLA